jgi:hypothetical protein
LFGFQAVLSTETILTFLTAHSKLLSNFLEKFYQMAISASSDDNFQLKEKHLLLLVRYLGSGEHNWLNL